MSAAREKVEIGGMTLSIRKFDPFTGLEVLGELQRHFLTPLAAGLEAGKAETEEQAMSAMTEALTKLSTGINGAILRQLATMLVVPDNVTLQMSEHDDPMKATADNIRAKCDVGQLIDIMVSVVKVNFAKVFTDGLARIGQARSLKAPNLSVRSTMN